MMLDDLVSLFVNSVPMGCLSEILSLTEGTNDDTDSEICGLSGRHSFCLSPFHR